MVAVIMPIYNTEQYLREAIESVIHQTLSFEENIRLYLLDDASTDGSSAICQEYKDKYPENIIFTHFDENQGVSALRNYGVRQCRDYNDAIVGFLDSDDIYDEDVLEKVSEFFENHKDLNMATVEIMFFDAYEGEHKINWRFREREVVDIKEDYMYPHYYIGGAFVRRSALERIEFNEHMNFWEDALAINQVILDEGKYGLVSGVYYYYRKRQDESSLVDEAWRNKERYTSFLKDGYGSIIEYSKKTKRRVVPYVQFLVAYHMRLFMVKKRQESVSVTLTDEEIAELRNNLGMILKKIKVSVILQLPTSLPIIEAMLSTRAGKQVRVKKKYLKDDCLFVYKGVELARMSGRRVHLDPPVSNPESQYFGRWKATFYTPVYAMKPDDSLFYIYHGERKEAEEYRSKRNLLILGKRLRCYYHARFVLTLPDDWDEVTFGITMAEGGVDILLNSIKREEWELNQNNQEKNEEL